MDKLIDLISSNEDWLVQRILDYAKAKDYTKYTPTLVEAWRLSISGLSESFIKDLKKYNGIPDLGPDEDYSKDPITAFGILEAQRHRSRGVTLSMFLGLMKYYRQSYIDLISESHFDNNDKNKYYLFTNRFFDKVEIVFSSKWIEISEKSIIAELQSKNRFMANEKDKYLTIFDSLNAPMFFLNEKNIIENLNHATSEYFDFNKTSGEKYYEIIKKEVGLYSLKDEIKDFTSSTKETAEFEKSILTKKGLCYFQVKMKRMLDVSGKFFGTVVILNDLTELKNTSESLKQSEERYKNILKDQTEFITRFTPEGIHTFVNDAYCNYMNMKAEDLIGKSFFSFLPKEDYGNLKSLLESLTLSNPIKDIEHRYVIKENPRWLHWINRAIFDNEGNIIEYQAVGRDITERKIAEDRSKSKNKELEDIIEFLPDATFIINKGKRIMAWNRAMEEMTGISKKDIVGKDRSYCAVPFYGKQRPFLIDLIFESESKISSKYDFVKRKGNSLYIETFAPALYNNKGAYIWAIASPLLDEEDNIVGGIESIRDITEQKRAEVALLKEKEFINTLVQASPVFYVAMDTNGKVILMNYSMLKAIGYSLDEVVGVGYISNFVPEEDREILSQTFRKILNDHEQAINENNVLTKDGRKLLVEWHGRAILNEEGANDFFFGVGLDITDRHKFQEALKKSEEKYRELVENANSIILKFDDEGRILSMNEFGLKFFGYSENELIGKYGIGTIIPEVETSGKDLKKIIRNMITQEYKYSANINENLKKTGERVWIYWTNKPMKDENGNITGILSIGTDITERKKAEDKVNELNETLRILNKILRHDILNDLTIVLNAIDLMSVEDDRLKLKASKAVTKSIDLIERMRELEQGLISDRHVQKYEVNEVVQEISKNYPEIEFTIIGKCKICSDEAIFSVIDNLIRNAFIHGKTKKIDIDILRKENLCEVKITDYGIGISNEIKSHIFEEGFSYGDNRSTGLGLYIVKKIMERYGGSIKVIDNVPTGAIFILEYPLNKSRDKICGIS